jgi:3-oxoadipate enol-lactonase
VSAVALHHELHGPAGAPVLLLAGSLGTSLAMWRPQVQALAGRFRVIAIDHRGHGSSPVPPAPYTIDQMGADVLSLLDVLGVQRATYAGLSIGGMVGIWLGAHAPERLERLVLICTSAYAPPPERWLERAAAVRAAGSSEAVADAVVARWFTPGWAAAHPGEVAAHRAMIAATDPEGYAGCCEAIAAMDQRADLPRIALPTLVIGALGDEALPPEHQRLIATQVPGARLELIADAAHIASVEQPAAISALIAGA